MCKEKCFFGLLYNRNKVLFLLLILICNGSNIFVRATASTPSAGNVTQCPGGHDSSDGIKLASFRWQEIGVYFTITAFIIIAGFAKLGFHKLSWLSSKVPESCLLVLLGLTVSLILFFSLGKNDAKADPCHTNFKFPEFTSETFFFILLPPIVLDSAYSLHDRVFLDNLGTVLVFAVIGTLMNVFAIGGTLFGVNEAGLIPNMNLTLTDAFVFSSLISAVDPVAVLAIFQELHVNQNLYFLIFGESLLNDGVTVVLYNTMQSFRRMAQVTIAQVMLAALSFFTVSLGGVLIGMFYGALTAVVTKWTSSVRVVEPLALLGLAYLSYLTAELFHFSGIICLIVCGLIQAHYGFYNISQKSYICVKYFTKMASATSDTVIFMFLGMLLVNEDHKFNYAFVLWSLFLCLLFRFIIVFSLSAITNIYRTKPIGIPEQFIAAYGGLRGAVAFSLASTLDENMTERNTYIFTTLIVILFTIFIQGISIKPLVNLLKITRSSSEKKTLLEEVTDTSMDHIMAGIEEVMGHHGDFYLRELIRHYNEKYFKKWLLHEECDTKLGRLFEKIALSEHYAHLYGPVALVEDHIKPIISYPVKYSPVAPLSPVRRDEIFFGSTDNRLSIDSYRSDKERRPTLSEVEELRLPSRMSIRSFFPSRKSQVSSAVPPTPQPQGSDTDILRKALLDNKYNRLHYKYNRNLVNEEDQELENHLNRRSINAKRMSSLASAQYITTNSILDSDNNQILGQPPPKKRPGSVLAKGFKVTFDALAQSLVLLQRHKNRRTLIRRSTHPQDDIQEDVEEDLASLLLEAQEAHIRELGSNEGYTSRRASTGWVSDSVFQEPESKTQPGYSSRPPTGNSQAVTDETLTSPRTQNDATYKHDDETEVIPLMDTQVELRRRKSQDDSIV